MHIYGNALKYGRCRFGSLAVGGAHGDYEDIAMPGDGDEKSVVPSLRSLGNARPLPRSLC